MKKRAGTCPLSCHPSWGQGKLGPQGQSELQRRTPSPQVPGGTHGCLTPGIGDVQALRGVSQRSLSTDGGEKEASGLQKLSVGAALPTGGGGRAGGMAWSQLACLLSNAGRALVSCLLPCRPRGSWMFLNVQACLWHSPVHSLMIVSPPCARPPQSFKILEGLIASATTI